MHPLDELKSTKDILPPDVRARVLALGDAAVPGLLAILGDEELGSEDSPTGGWPPVHSARLLAQLGATAAIEPMLDLLLDIDDDTYLGNEISLRLPSLGRPVIEPALRRLEMAWELEDDDAERSMLGVLAWAHVKDERIYQAILRHFDVDPIFGAMCLREYGDPRALPILRQEMTDFDINDAGFAWASDFAELRDAYQALGGVLPDALFEKGKAIAEAWQAHRAMGNVATRPGAKVGRNDPCPCGSGKKYKKCCLGT